MLLLRKCGSYIWVGLLWLLPFLFHYLFIFFFIFLPTWFSCSYISYSFSFSLLFSTSFFSLILLSPYSTTLLFMKIMALHGSFGVRIMSLGTITFGILERSLEIWQICASRFLVVGDICSWLFLMLTKVCSIDLSKLF